MDSWKVVIFYFVSSACGLILAAVSPLVFSPLLVQIGITWPSAPLAVGLVILAVAALIILIISKRRNRR